MTQPLTLGNCCGPSIPGIRRITLPDGDQESNSTILTHTPLENSRT
jgi:hypothetical protein